MKTVLGSLGKIALGAGMLAIFAGPAQAATIYATTVVDQSRGDAVNSGVANNLRENTYNALGAADGAANPQFGFYSIGNGGDLTVSFGQTFTGPGLIFEITGGTVSSYNESVDVYASVDNSAGSYSLVGQITNLAAQGGGTVVFSNNGPFSFLKLVDTSTQTGDGFDVDAIGVSQVPVPAAAWLFGSALLGLSGVARRKKAKAIA